MKRSLPQNYRVITAEFTKHVLKNKKTYLMALLVLEGIFLLSFLTTSLFLFNRYALLEKKRTATLKKLVSWEKEITKYPTYPEVYYNAALYAETVGDRQKALEYVNRSILLNPNFEASKKLQQKLMKQED